MKIFYFPDRIFMVKLRTISESVMWYGSARVFIMLITENAAEMDSLIANPDRKFPVIVFMAADKEWTEKFDVDYFSYLVWLLCAHYVCKRKRNQKLLLINTDFMRDMKIQLRYFIRAKHRRPATNPIFWKRALKLSS